MESPCKPAFGNVSDVKSSAGLQKTLEKKLKKLNECFEKNGSAIRVGIVKTSSGHQRAFVVSQLSGGKKKADFSTDWLYKFYMQTLPGGEKPIKIWEEFPQTTIKWDDLSTAEKEECSAEKENEIKMGWRKTERVMTQKRTVTAEGGLTMICAKLEEFLAKEGKGLASECNASPIV